LTLAKHVKKNVLNQFLGFAGIEENPQAHAEGKPGIAVIKQLSACCSPLTGRAA